MLKDLPDRTLKLLSGAGIHTAVDVRQAGKDGLVAIPGIGEATAIAILEAAQAEVGELAGEDSNPDLSAELAKVKALLDSDETEASPDVGEDSLTVLSRPDEVVMRLHTLSTAVINGRVIYQGETRRVPYAHYEAAVREYPGAWLVRFHRNGEFEVA